MSAQVTANANANGTVRTPLLSFGADRIREMLPHRWPMLLLDRAYDVVPGQRGHGVKNVTVSEPFFAGHYPEQSVMPGVLIVESMAQLTAVVLASAWADATADDMADEMASGRAADRAAGPGTAARVGYLGAIRQMKFSRLVVPGDQLTLSAELGRGFGGLTPVQVRASVGTEPAAAGTLVVSERGGPGGDGFQ